MHKLFIYIYRIMVHSLFSYPYCQDFVSLDNMESKDLYLYDNEERQSLGVDDHMQKDEVLEKLRTKLNL